jgi:hypothetical protein
MARRDFVAMPTASGAPCWWRFGAPYSGVTPAVSVIRHHRAISALW